ncbi:MAG: hypothetical protein QOJ15_6494, partial [Bradyrhizobium sp.]|nr:hypothetical protein [Bradyrhizobium sp.]
MNRLLIVLAVTAFSVSANAQT